MHPGACFLWSRCRQPNTPRDFAARLARRAGEPPSPGPAERERGDRELITTSPSRGAPFEGGSDASTRWNPTVKASHQFRGHRMDQWRGRSTAARVAVLGVLASLLTALPVASSVTTPARAASSCPPAGCAVTVDAHDFASGSQLANFNFIVNDDNTKPPSDPLALSTESYTPIVAAGDQTRNTVTLKPGKYLITVRSLNHKMWGTYITLPDDAAADGSLTTRVDLTEASADHPLPAGKLRIFVFEDNAWTNGAPDAEEAAANQGLGGFKVGLEEQTGSEVTVDHDNKPLCGGICLTANDGFVEIDNLSPATYF